MFKYAEIKDATYNKVAQFKVKFHNRIEKHRAEDKKTFRSEGTLDLEYDNKWREHVNRLNEDDRLEFESSHRKIRMQNGDYYVVCLRTPNMVSPIQDAEGSKDNDESEDDSEHEDELDESEGDESEEEPEEEYYDEEIVRKHLPDGLKLKVEDDGEEVDSFDLTIDSIIDEDELDEDSDEEDDEEEDWKPHAVDELYFDICLLYTDHPSIHEERVEVPHQRPVVRDKFEVDDLKHAEEVIQNRIHQLDGRRIDEILQEADEDDKL